MTTSADTARRTLREVVARQIDEDDPPEGWQTAQRLQDHGLAAWLAAADVTRQLVLTLGAHTAAGIESGLVDEDGYREALGRLPLPTPDEIERTFVEVVREHQPVGADEVERLVAARLGLLEGQLTERILDRFEEELLDDGPRDPGRHAARCRGRA